MSVTSFLLLLACLLILAKCVSWICQKFSLPSVLGILTIGIIAGPSVLGWLHPNEILSTFASLGVIMLMFLAGLETDMEQMRRVQGAAFVSATCGVVVPLIAGTIFALALGHTLPVSLFIGTLLTATSVSISAQTLKEMGRLNSREGTTILGAAVIDDVLGLIVLSLVLAFTLGENPVWSILKMAAYFPIAYLLGRYGFPWLSRLLPRMLALEARLGMVLALVLLYSWAAEELGSVAAITGAYIAGLLIARTEMREWVHDGISKIGYALFIPLFFINIGIDANIASIKQVSPLLVGGLLVIAIVSKIVGCGSGAWVCRFPFLDAVRVGVGMISRGEVALITASLGLEAGLLSPSLYATVILIALVTTMITPPLLRLSYAVRIQWLSQPLLMARQWLAGASSPVPAVTAEEEE
ncbi:MAG: cation:proton antiporter [Thermogemmatispora sp.]|uniref:cation:proton antiporter n=1 Tax=Thermogemmatispora sp. TaxID=1968838 RepID=UPI00260FDCF8|nr:cation:proton antiporter [Thermogemmatispora sp.]MBX5458228.1 cation:proton antiporter [Thermogemmatispora sp.]